jgi:hypothetical protein
VRENIAWSKRLRPRNNRVHGHLGAELSAGELALLKEEVYSVDEEGRVRARPQYVSTPANVRFVFNVLHRVTGRKPRVDYSRQGWSDFKAAVRIRNRIVHPKRLAEYRISSAELATVERGLGWFRKSHGEFFRLTGDTANKLFPAASAQGGTRP